MPPTQFIDYGPLWYWIRKREEIRIKKESGSPPPWTEDEILQEYRFCNVRREDDRVTRWIKRYVRERFAGSDSLWLMLCICRVINWPGTIRDLIASGDSAWPSSDAFSPGAFAAALKERMVNGWKVYTGAYVIPAGSVSGVAKHDYLADVMVGNLWRERHKFPRPATSLRETYAWLNKFPGWGPFLSYQAVVDMRFTEILSCASDVSSWAAAGPGTIRGLNRVHGRPVDGALSQRQALDEILAIYEVAESQTGVSMDLSDVPNVLCETDKYLRVKLGEGRPRARYVSHGPSIDEVI